MDPFYEPEEEWSEPTKRAWGLLVDLARPFAPLDKSAIEAEIIAAGADLNAKNAAGLLLIVLAARTMEDEPLARLIEQSEPVSAAAQKKAIDAAGRFLDMGSTAKTLRESFAKRDARRREAQALAKAAKMAPTSRSLRRM